jgi:hypothetical protein
MDIDADELIEPRAKRWCPLDKEQPSNIGPTSLMTLDIDCFGHILHFLDSFEAMSLIQTGNSNIIRKTQSQLSHFEYVVDYKEGPVKRLQWPAILTQPLPSLHSVIINAQNVEFNSSSIDLLPPTLRRLSLKYCTIKSKFDTETTSGVQINCPNLTRLSLTNVNIIHGNGTTQRELRASEWVPSLLKHCNQLMRLSLIKLYFATTSYAVIVMKSLPLTLEQLSISEYLLSSSCQWPPHLHSLEIIGESESYGNHWFANVSFPSSITSVSCYRIHDSVTLQPLLERLPSTLSRLAIHLEGNAVFGQWLVDSIPRFSQLHTLEVEDSSFNNNEVDQSLITDLSILPRSITRLSDVFTFFPSQWHHLPGNVQVVSMERRVRWCDRGICIKKDVLVTPNMRHVPLTGDRLWLAGQLPNACHFPNVKHLCYDIAIGRLRGIPTGLFNLIDCSKLIRLDIFVTSATAFTWAPSNAILPNLQVFSMIYDLIYDSSSASPPVANIHKWISSLPRSLRRLSISDQLDGVKPVNDVLVLSGSTLPPSLLWCNLNFPNYILSFPSVVPQFLAGLELRCRGFEPDLSNSHLKTLPNTLVTVCVRAYSAPLTVSVTDEAMDAFCAGNRFHPKRCFNIEV